MQAVLDFRVDIGFIEGPCDSTEIISEPWLEDELVVFCCADFAVGPWSGHLRTAGRCAVDPA